MFTPILTHAAIQWLCLLACELIQTALSEVAIATVNQLDYTQKVDLFQIK